MIGRDWITAKDRLFKLTTSYRKRKAERMAMARFVWMMFAMNHIKDVTREKKSWF